MKLLKKLIIFGTVICMALGMVACGGNENKVSTNKFSSVTYTKPVGVDDMAAYWRETKTGSTGSKNNAPVENGVVLCPYYTLKVNGKDVPVYSTRATNSVHSFAWIDVEGAPEDFALDIELNTQNKYKGVVVLPEKTGVEATLSDYKVTARITEYGDYSFAFALDKPTAFDVENEPLTLIVAPEQTFEIPEGYDVQTISPDTYGYNDLILDKDNTVYVFESGEYEIRRIIASKRKNIDIYFQAGAYFSVYETPTQGLDSYNIAGPAFGITDCENVRILGRGLFDFSGVRGRYVDENGNAVDMTQYVFNFYRNKDMYISGITTINSNHWTFRICGCEDVLAEWNVMLGYRNYSDGFIYSDCKNATARYLFARTGDDAIEVKALGWHGACWWDDSTGADSQTAKNILFEKCTVWNDSAAAFGVIYENYTPVDGVTFRDCSVGFTTCDWSPNNSSLNIRLAYPGEAHWKNIVFEDFEIFKSLSNAFTLEWNLSGGSVENVLVKNIRIREAQAAIRVNNDTSGIDAQEMAGLCSNFVFEDIYLRGVKMTEADKDNVLSCSYSSKGTPSDYKKLFTIK